MSREPLGPRPPVCPPSVCDEFSCGITSCPLHDWLAEQARRAAHPEPAPAPRPHPPSEVVDVSALEDRVTDRVTDRVGTQLTEELPTAVLNILDAVRGKVHG